MLTEEDYLRYNRQISLADIGREGQEKLSSASILIVGAGGLGSPAAYYLAAAGIGALGLVDGDRVDLSNLQRQILHATPDVGRLKVESAHDTLSLLNPFLKINSHPVMITPDNADELVAGYDFVVDCTDNFAAKFLVNDVCVRQGVAYSHAGVLGYLGQTMTVVPGRSACYRCVFEKEPAQEIARTRSVGGIFGVLPGVIGTIQAAEAIKFITGCGTLLNNTLLTCDIKTMEFRSIVLKQNPTCAVCG